MEWKNAYWLIHNIERFAQSAINYHNNMKNWLDVDPDKMKFSFDRRAAIDAKEWHKHFDDQFTLESVIAIRDEAKRLVKIAKMDRTINSDELNNLCKKANNEYIIQLHYKLNTIFFLHDTYPFPEDFVVEERKVYPEERIQALRALSNYALMENSPLQYTVTIDYGKGIVQLLEDCDLNEEGDCITYRLDDYVMLEGGQLQKK